ncbi:MAG: hypothetical protein WD118_09380 [Phycisphaeraceae bacterium]
MSRDPDARPPAGPGPDGRERPGEVDEIAVAKARLLENDEPRANPTDKLNDFIRGHPYIAAGAAIGAGLLVARVQTLRKLATVGGIWAGKQMLYRQLRRMGR